MPQDDAEIRYVYDDGQSDMPKLPPDDITNFVPVQLYIEDDMTTNVANLTEVVLVRQYQSEGKVLFRTTWNFQRRSFQIYQWVKREMLGVPGVDVEARLRKMAFDYCMQVA